ncbi:MAG TPA: hypothetical protein VGM59_17195 [Dongiaceae bacterium]
MTNPWLERVICRAFRPAGTRAAPDLYVLEPLPGNAPSTRPPVRIFVGSEPAQRAAERVLIWSIMRRRDPRRTYEIHVMRHLGGFRRTGWSTGFANYRFAVPHYAGFSGRALYSDVGQIYLSDPAELFDADTGGSGFLAVSNRSRQAWAFDTSVMLIDCGRMAPFWTLHAAQALSPEQMMDMAAASNLRGELPRQWNARDRGHEYRLGRTKLLNFADFSAQPWRPFPRQYRYRQEPEGKLWLDLEREADAACFLWPNNNTRPIIPEWPVRRPASGEVRTPGVMLQDLMEYRPWIYFADFTASIAIGYFACWEYFTVKDYSPAQFFWFLVAGLALFRAGVFVNEIARMPEGRMVAFKTYWNLICGIPLLMPSFKYELVRPNARMSAEQAAASESDNEIPLGLRPERLTGHLLRIFAAPVLGAARFLLIGPLLILHPRIRGWLWARLPANFPIPHQSGELMPTAGRRRNAAEICCFLVVLAVVFAYADDIVPWSTFAELYALCVFAVALRCIQNLFEARLLLSNGQGAKAAAGDSSSVIMLPGVENSILSNSAAMAGVNEDGLEPALGRSVTVAGPPVIDALLLPVGSRYRGLREALPSVPYHNLGAAHRRLMAELPADSTYRRHVIRLGTALRVFMQGLSDRRSESV